MKIVSVDTKNVKISNAEVTIIQHRGFEHRASSSNEIARKNKNMETQNIHNG